LIIPDFRPSTNWKTVIETNESNTSNIGLLPRATKAFEGFLKSVKDYTKRGITPVFGLEDMASSGRELASFLLTKKKTVKQVDASLTWSERKNQSITHKADSYDALCIARVLMR
jgi:hypothetical protein